MSAKRQPDGGAALTKELTVANVAGLHMRPAKDIVMIANRFRCDLFVEKDGHRVNGKSIMGLLTLVAGHGSKLTVHTEGPDASAALAEIEALFKRKFNEE